MKITAGTIKTIEVSPGKMSNLGDPKTNRATVGTIKQEDRDE
jgi:hypothetical protein